MAAAWLTWAFLGSIPSYAASSSSRLELAGPERAIEVSAAAPVASSGLAAREGQPVSAGEVILQLRDHDLRVRLQEEQGRMQGLLRRRQAAVAQIGREERRLMLALEQGARAVVRAEQLLAETDGLERAARARWAQRTGSTPPWAARAQSEIDQARAQRAAADSALSREQRQQSWEQSEGLARVADETRALSQLDIELAAVGAELARLQWELETRRVRAPAAGRLRDVVTLAPDAAVAPGTRIASLQPAGRHQLVARFARAEPGATIRPGQRATFWPDGTSGAASAQLPAQVNRVLTEDGERRVVMLDLQDVHVPGVRPGLTGRVVIELGSVSPLRLLLRTLSGVDLI